MITPQEARRICPIFDSLHTDGEREYVRQRGYRRLYFAHTNAGEPVVLAHTTNCQPYGASQRRQMPWPTWSNPFRSYYKKGDLIMVHMARRGDLVQQFPSLAERYGSDTVGTYLNVLDYVLFGNRPATPRYKTAWRISSVQPGRDGRGVVNAEGVVWHGRKAAYLHDATTSFDLDQLTWSFTNTEIASGMSEVADFLESYGHALIQTMIALESGGESSVFSGVRTAFIGASRRIASRLGARVAALIERKAVEIAAKMLEAFAMGVAEDVVRQLRESRTHSMRDVRWSVAMSKGATKAADKLLSAVFGDITKIFDPFTPGDSARPLSQADAAAYMRAIGSPLANFGRYLAGQFLVAVGRAPIEAVVHALIEAIPSEGNRAGYEERFLGRLAETARSALRINMSSVISTLTSPIVEYVSENNGAMRMAQDQIYPFAEPIEEPALAGAR